jgi:hypothetical protein
MNTEDKIGDNLTSNVKHIKLDKCIMFKYYKIIIKEGEILKSYYIVFTTEKKIITYDL